MVKATLGTGCSILMNIGAKPISSKNKMLTTVCWSIKDRIDFAFEGAIVSCGSAIDWLRTGMHLFDQYHETERMANEIPGSDGVVFIPAFSGLGAPHWQMNRKASFNGITFGTTKNHMVRAALESIAFQIKDVVDAMSLEVGYEISSISINGGITQNNFVLHSIADLLQIDLNCQNQTDISAFGAALLAGLQEGIWPDLNKISEIIQMNSRIIQPDPKTNMIKGYSFWKELIENYKI